MLTDITYIHIFTHMCLDQRFAGPQAGVPFCNTVTITPIVGDDGEPLFQVSMQVDTSPSACTSLRASRNKRASWIAEVCSGRQRTSRPSMFTAHSELFLKQEDRPSSLMRQELVERLKEWVQERNPKDEDDANGSCEQSRVEDGAQSELYATENSVDPADRKPHVDSWRLVLNFALANFMSSVRGCTEYPEETFEHQTAVRNLQAATIMLIDGAGSAGEKDCKVTLPTGILAESAARALSVQGYAVTVLEEEPNTVVEDTSFDALKRKAKEKANVCCQPDRANSNPN